MNLFIFLIFNLFITDTKIVKVIENVNVGGTNVLTVRGENASARTNVILDRLKYFLSPDLQLSDFNIKKLKNGDNTICVKEQVLVTVTKKDAFLNKSTVDKLAQKMLETISVKMLEVKPLK